MSFCCTCVSYMVLDPVYTRTNVYTDTDVFRFRVFKSIRIRKAFRQYKRLQTLMIRLFVPSNASWTETLRIRRVSKNVSSRGVTYWFYRHPLKNNRAPTLHSLIFLRSQILNQVFHTTSDFCIQSAIY